jgi:hypothetical protein
MYDITFPPLSSQLSKTSSSNSAAPVGEALASERSSFLRSLVELRLQLETDRRAAALAVAERDELKTR